MALYTDSITLLDRTEALRTVSDEIPSGDMKPWRIRLELVNTGETGKDNNGMIHLRIDENKTFIKTGPLLMEEDAKRKYLIECKITQTIGGSTVTGKTFRFRLGTPSIDVDENQGAILKIKLQEIQSRTKEAISSKELRFVTPYTAAQERVNELNSFTVMTGFRIAVDSNNLPNDPNLKQHYVPMSPRSIKDLFDEIMENLSKEDVYGGTFTDYYYDYDAQAAITNEMKVTFDAIGATDSGIVLDPISTEAIDAEQQQSAGTDFFRFRNQVIARGSAGAGSLPTEHSYFSSRWLHAKIREEWSNSTDYVKGDTVKKTFFLNTFASTNPTSGPARNDGIRGTTTVPKQDVIRFFVCMNAVAANAANDASDPTESAGRVYWREDFIIYPSFDKTGHYKAGDVIYNDSGSGSSPVRFYQATEEIYDWSLNRFRENDNGNGTWSYPANTTAASLKGTKHLDNSTGFLKFPNETDSGFRRLDNLSSPEDAIPDQKGTGELTGGNVTFQGWEAFSPWTNDVFDWEKNMCALKTGSLVRGATAGLDGSPNRYVGMVPDWNLTKDVYEKQNVTAEFEGVSMKWVHSIVTEPPQDAKMQYHGQRFLVGASPPSTMTYGGSNPFYGQGNKVTQFDQNKTSTNNKADKWQFSRVPHNGEVINNLDDGRVYQYSTDENPDAWVIVWQVQRNGTGQKPNFISSATPFHIVKDVYKSAGFEGTPNSAITFRYIWDSTSSSGATQSNYRNKVNSTSRNYTNDNDESLMVRKNSRGAWLWFWNPFPRLGHTDNGTVDIGSQYGYNGGSSSSLTSSRSGFTTLNTYNLNTDRFQETYGWNNGLKSEDMGRISSLSFKMKVGIYSVVVDSNNDDFFWEMPDIALVIGVPKVPMTFWAVDMFDRVWYKKFELRRNGYWDEVKIDFGDMSQHNLYFPRFDELWEFWGRPLGFTNFALKQKEYTGVAFDWRFVRGWGVQYDGSYDPNGYYNGGFDDWWDTMMQAAEQFKSILYNAYARLKNDWDAATVPSSSNTINAQGKMPPAYAIQREATISIDGLHYDKELVANSDDELVLGENEEYGPRTSIEFFGDVDDYITLKIQAKGRKARLSFYPQFWHLRAIGDVRMKVGHSFKVKGDRIPDHPNMEGVEEWVGGSNTFDYKDKVRYPNTGGYTYQAIRDVPNTAGSPDGEPTYWENINQLACAEVTHIIDHSGYHMEVTGRRKFIVTGD